MIALSYVDKQLFLAVFPEHCLKATPDPDFLSNLYGCDMPLCPDRRLLSSCSAFDFYLEKFDAINSSSRIPELLVWMKSQVCPTIIVLFILDDVHCTSIETP